MCPQRVSVSRMLERSNKLTAHVPTANGACILCRTPLRGSTSRRACSACLLRLLQQHTRCGTTQAGPGCCRQGSIGGPGWTSEDVGVRGCLRAAMPPVEPQAAVPCAVLARVLGWARTRMFESPDGCLHLQVVRGLVGGQCLTAIRNLQETATALLAIMAGTGTGRGRSSSGGSSDTASSASGSTPPSGPAAGAQALGQQLEGALQELEQAIAHFDAADIDQRSDQMAAPFQFLLKPAGQVAALVEAYYQQPEQRAAAVLELAQAAATRSCANLRCPNVAGQGREAEGRRNQRCSACRAVRYCCRECSVVDWKAGHKRVCAALAAAATQAGAGAAEQQA